MEKIKYLDIVRVKREKGMKIKDQVAREIPFTVMLNGREIATLLCSPNGLENLAVGYMVSEGIIPRDIGIKKVNIGRDGYYADVETDKDFGIPEKVFLKRVIVPGCGRCPSFYDLRDARDCQPVPTDTRATYGQIVSLMSRFQKKSSLFKKTGGVHSAALSNTEDIEIFAEDIVRHNAIDKVIGESLLTGIAAEGKFLVTSGRVSSEIVIKAVRQRIPVIISPGAPTDLAVEFAEKMRVTLAGFVRGNQMNVYTHNDRIKGEK